MMAISAVYENCRYHGSQDAVLILMTYLDSLRLSFAFVRLAIHIYESFRELQVLK